MKKLIGLIIIIVVFGISIYLILKIPKSVNSNVIAEESVSIQNSSEEWLGIFLQGQRIGYSFTKISRTDTGLIVENRSQMTLIMMNTQRTLSTHVFVHTDKDYTLKNFILEIKTPGHPTKIEGKIEGTNLELTSYSQGTHHTQTITLKEKPYFPDAIEEVIKKKKMKPGDEITIPYFDPTTQSTASAMIKVFDKERVKVLDKEFVGTRIEIDYMGINSILWLDNDYKLIKESSPAMGMEMIPLSREQALAEIEPVDAFDLLSFFSVKIDKPIPDPNKLSYLKIELSNITIEGLDLTDDYQKLIEKEPIIIESYKADIATLPDLSAPISEHKEFLESSVYIQCKNSEIIAKAHEIVGNEKNAKKVVAKLVEGVHKFVKKNPTASLPSAIDVLRTKEGDCNEHSILFAALARAKGIPTKIYVGLVNLHGFAFYYHAWCAVWLGKWVPVDPTLNQFPADVGHLKLKEGEISEQAQVLKVVGKLNINVLNYQED
ncbi:transglutaminase domain-containing protein [candidate division WOR-3 bacterium]|nr:transglutaminase domain-containing protein [candidate division WOR-3 bacterium]